MSAIIIIARGWKVARDQNYVYGLESFMATGVQKCFFSSEGKTKPQTPQNKTKVESGRGMAGGICAIHTSL